MRPLPCSTFNGVRDGGDAVCSASTCNTKSNSRAQGLCARACKEVVVATCMGAGMDEGERKLLSPTATNSNHGSESRQRGRGGQYNIHGRDRCNNNTLCCRVVRGQTAERQHKHSTIAPKQMQALIVVQHSSRSVRTALCVYHRWPFCDLPRS